MLVVALGVSDIRSGYLLCHPRIRQRGAAFNVNEVAMLRTGGVAYGQFVSGSHKLAAKETGDQQGRPNAHQSLPQPSKA